jgi:hypothetical protein
LLAKNEKQEQDVKDLYKRHVEMAGYYKEAMTELAATKGNTSITEASIPQEAWAAKKYLVVKL